MYLGVGAWGVHVCIGHRSVLGIVLGTLLSGIILFGSCSSLARLRWLTREPQDPLASTPPVMVSQACVPIPSFLHGYWG